MRIEAREITRRYAGRVVLSASVSFAGGNLYALLGPNGSGKSTLLRLLAMVDRPDSGEISYFDGARPLAADISLHRRIVMVPDRKGLFNDTVMNNVGYGLAIRKVPKAERRHLVCQALEVVGLARLREMNALGLSTGEAQRLCLAMALAVDPDVILLDEPTSSLDPYNVSMVEEIIATMKEKRRLIVLVTHNIFQARRLADEVLLLWQGNIVEQAKGGNFFENPASPVTRRFLSGEMVF